MRLLVFILALAMLPAAAWAACTPASGYSFATAVTLAAPGATLTDFPQPFSTNGSNLASLKAALAANAQADGDDIIFRTEDPASTIAHTMIAPFNAATGEYFAILGPLTRTGSLTICVNYGNAGATSTSSTAPLASLAAVIGCDTPTDHTGNGHWPVEAGTPGTTASPICPAWTLDETVPSYLTLTDSGSSGEIDSSTTFRFSILVNSDSATTDADSERFVWRNVTTTTQRWPQGIWAGGGTIGKGGTPNNTFGPVSAGGWHWLTVVYDDAVADNSRAWLDGVLVDTDSPAYPLSSPTGDLTISFPTGSLAWSGAVGLVMWGLSADAGSTAWQAYEAASLLDPNSVFSIPSAPAQPLKLIGTTRMYRLSVAEWADVAAATCGPDEIQLGDACGPDPGGALGIITGGIW